MKQAALYICYYNVAEPLVQTQVIAYVRELAKSGVDMHLLTFEKNRTTGDERRKIRSELSSVGITWHSLRYHKRPSLPATLYDIGAGTLKGAWICRKYGIGLVHARSHVPAAMAHVLKRIFGHRFLFDVRGLLAEEYVDAGHWKEGELKFRLTKGMERAFFRSADAFVMLTHRIKEELVAAEPALARRSDDIEVIPCCVDMGRFSAVAGDRAAYRRERGWEGRRVITYVGKLGGWYLADEMARFFAAAHRSDPRLFFQILTQSDFGLMQTALQKAGVSSDTYDIRYAPPSELSRFLGASDAGISFIRTCYSKRASSPTKVAEYLAAGLPVIANAGIGDCDRLLGPNGVGVVVDDFSDEEFERAAGRLNCLLDDEEIGSRCREFAGRELSLAEVGGPRYGAVYSRILGDTPAPVASQAPQSL